MRKRKRKRKRKTFGPESGGRSKKTREKRCEEKEEVTSVLQYMIIIIKWPVCYKKVTKMLFGCLFVVRQIKPPPLTNVFLGFIFSSIRDIFCAVALIFSLYCTEITSHDFFFLLDGGFSTLFRVGWTFHIISLISK